MTLQDQNASVVRLCLYTVTSLLLNHPDKLNKLNCLLGKDEAVR